MPYTTAQQSKQQDMSKDRWPFIKRFTMMQNEAMTHYQTWRELSTWIYPSRGFFFNEAPDRGYKIDHTTILDGHAQRCVRDMASGMMSGMTSPSRPWFKWGLDDPDLEAWGPVKEWLDDVTRIQLEVYARSNIYDCLFSCYEEVGTFGTAAMILVEDFIEALRGHAYTIGEYFLQQGPDGRINSFARQTWMTVGQMVEQFGYDNCSPTVRANYDTHVMERWVRVNHLVEPNDNRIPNYVDFKNMAYRSLYWEYGSMQNTYLALRGFKEFPLFCPRWQTKTTADNYGRGPGWYALGHIKQLQAETKQKLVGLDRITDPPVQADASVQGEINLLPGGVTRTSSLVPNTGVRPAYEVNLDINAVRTDIEQLKRDISEDFFADLFKMFINIDRGNMTATEISERQAEKLNMLSPVVEKMDNELLNPLNSRAFNILLSQGKFPEIPKELHGKEIRPRYISTLAMAQKMLGINAIDQAVTFIGDKCAALVPDSLDVLDLDVLGTEYASALGVPAKGIRSPEQIAELRAQRAKQQAIAQQQQNMALAAEAAAKGAKATKDMGTTPMGQNTALDGLMSGMKGPGAGGQ